MVPIVEKIILCSPALKCILTDLTRLDFFHSGIFHLSLIKILKYYYCFKVHIKFISSTKKQTFDVCLQ